MYSSTLFDLSGYEVERDRRGCDQDDPRYVCPPIPKSMPESKPRNGEVLDSGITAFIETYSPGGTARGYREYFRLRYWDKFAGRWRHRHIKGGCTDAPMAIRRKQAIEDAIALGKSPQWLISLCG